LEDELEKPTKEFEVTCGFDQDWPEGRTLIMNKDKSVMIKVNHMNHLEISFKQKNPKGYVEFIEAFQELLAKIEGKRGFSYDPKFGFTCPLSESNNSFQIETQLIVKHDKEMPRDQLRTLVMSKNNCKETKFYALANIG